MKSSGDWFLYFLQARCTQFLINLPEENVILSEMIKFVLSMPFRESRLDENKVS